MILLFAKTTPHGVVWTTLNDEECSKKLIQNKIKHDNIIKKKYLRSTEKLKNLAEFAYSIFQWIQPSRNNNILRYYHINF